MGFGFWVLGSGLSFTSTQNLKPRTCFQFITHHSAFITKFKTLPDESSLAACVGENFRALVASARQESHHTRLPAWRWWLPFWCVVVWVWRVIP